MKTILVVDDDKLNLSAARKVLSGEYKVIPVVRGTQALSYLENEECDMILLDISMPEMDGFELLRKIRTMENGKDIPVIFLTADNDTETECMLYTVDFLCTVIVSDDGLHSHSQPHYHHYIQHQQAINDTIGTDSHIATVFLQTIINEYDNDTCRDIHGKRRHSYGEDTADDAFLHFPETRHEMDKTLFVTEVVYYPYHSDKL